MQIAYQWDQITKDKTVKGFIISAGGALLAGFVLLAPEVTDFLQSGDPIAWNGVLAATWGALSGGIINAAKQWLAGEGQV